MYPLESGIPIPESNFGKKKREALYPFAEMHPGNSFFVPCTEEEASKTASRVSGAITAHKRRSGTANNFLTRRVEGGFRVWCVAG